MSGTAICRRRFGSYHRTFQAYSFLLWWLRHAARQGGAPCVASSRSSLTVSPSSRQPHSPPRDQFSKWAKADSLIEGAGSSCCTNDQSGEAHHGQEWSRHGAVRGASAEHSTSCWGFSKLCSFWICARVGYDLPKMSEPEYEAVFELGALRPQNDHTAIANVGLSECCLSAPMAKETWRGPW